MSSVWLIGNKGMLGTELSLLLEKTDMPFVGTGREVDITDLSSLETFAEKQTSLGAIDWIVNCAAYTAVDKAEDEVDACRKINVQGTANIAAIANKIGARLIHVSTDYVFNGQGSRPYREDDATDPIGVYGLTKRDGELAALENNPHTFIIRTAWLYGKHGANFVRTMIKLMNERDSLKVVNDQHGSPTWAFDLAGIIVEIIKSPQSTENPPYGIYHYANEGTTVWFDFAQEIYRQGRKLNLVTKDCSITSCTSAEYPAKVKRPLYSVLDKSKIKAALGMAIPRWDTSLEAFLESLAEDKS